MRVSRDEVTRRRRRALLVVAAAALLVGVVAGSSNGVRKVGDGGSGDAAAARCAVPEAVAGLPLSAQVGQTLVLAFAGSSAPDYVRRRLRSADVAGVILFGPNVANPGQLRALTASLQRAARGSALVMTDQEGGSIRNVPWVGPVAAQPAQSDPRASALAGARGLRSAGVNVTLAPVLEVPRGSGSALRRRAFRGGPREIGRAGRAAVQGWSDGRVGATLKHFPGLGAAVRNTDDAPVTITLSRSELERVDLAPFREALKTDPPLVMAGHALYPAYDRRRIASQSQRILGDVLRKQLGFDGVIVTDSLEADAVTARSSVERAALRSLDAGADLVLMTGRGSYLRVRNTVLARARQSKTFRCKVQHSAGRVVELKRRLGLRPPRPGD